MLKVARCRPLASLIQTSMLIFTQSMPLVICYRLPPYLSLGMVPGSRVLIFALNE